MSLGAIKWLTIGEEEIAGSTGQTIANSRARNRLKQTTPAEHQLQASWTLQEGLTTWIRMPTVSEARAFLRDLSSAYQAPEAAEASLHPIPA